MSAIDRVIVGAAGTTVVGLAGVAGAISYSHMAELARLHGEVGWRAHAFPVSVDGIEIVASLVLLAHRRAGSRSGWLPRAGLLAGAPARGAANLAGGGSASVGAGGGGGGAGGGGRVAGGVGGAVGAGRVAGPGPVGWVGAAGGVRARLVPGGERVNRRNLAAGLRAAGHRVRNDRLGPLLRLVTGVDDR